MLLGSIASSDQMHEERAFYVDLASNTIPPSTTKDYSVLSYVMPMTGVVAVSMLVELWWTGGTQQVVASAAGGTTPAASAAYNGNRTAPSTTGQAHVYVPGLAYWNSVTAGSTVILKARVQALGGTPTVTAVTASGWLRAYRS
jgi:hypothetical protein